MDDQELEYIREQNRWNEDRAQETKEEKPKSSLPFGTIVLMFGTAILIDLLQLIFTPSVLGGSIISTLATFLFFMWFKIHGISFITPKRLAAMTGGGFLEIIPFLNILPVWTGVVWYMISTTKIREVISKVPGGTSLTAVQKNINR